VSAGYFSPSVVEFFVIETPPDRISRGEEMEAATARAQRPVDAQTRARWETLYVSYHQMIWRTLRRIGFSEDAAAEATQQAFLVSVQRSEDVREGSERAFLFSTAIRIAKTTARKLRRLDFGDDVDLPDGGSGSQHADHRDQALKILDRVLRSLDEDLIVVFSLYEIEGFSSPEIAELLGIPLGTVASRLRRAREGFRAAAQRVEVARRSSSDIPTNSSPSRGQL
jgi:RNA polymerase sigma-70 factor, ECF subfamily